MSMTRSKALCGARVQVSPDSTPWARILSGAVNPSGKTSDTFVADLTATPTANNFGSFFYDNTEEFNMDAGRLRQETQQIVAPSFVNYVEGIYVGYRFWETAAAEGLINYDESVVYPFGYGLSYTTFTQEMGEITETDGTISFDVTVTNTGDVAGKDVVEVYYNPPYTNGGIEKATANLIAFEKTETLEPGASETVTISLSTQRIWLPTIIRTHRLTCLRRATMRSASTATLIHVIDSQTYTVPETITYSGDNTRSTDQTEVTNQFDVGSR